MLDLTSTKIEPIQSKSCVARFACGEREIDRWAQEKAWKFQERGRARVFTAKLSGSSSSAGFYSLSFSTENNSKLAKSEDRDAWKNGAPLIYIDYLAVQRPYQGKKLGTLLMMDALKRAHIVWQHVAFYGVALRSLNDRTTQLYEKYGFGKAPDEDVHPLMILPIWTVNDLFK
ncbi:GNAT family N-acetyltransferase [Loktanella sp. IMCC34160]|uniref:GNAT family N-acetyltransferase n=1 Tax=Loktanella sp. IMCC34160 TaxID=2510646 RepID=UPI00101C4E52|nr:GNAT family N-acetyltransferase [Loktanella sp. IMCC34160]RYG91172.1 GNAT family N-acetyltransferase [Loktanella sp. IMCC34160]